MNITTQDGKKVSANQFRIAKNAKTGKTEIYAVVKGDLVVCAVYDDSDAAYQVYYRLILKNSNASFCFS